MLNIATHKHAGDAFPGIALKPAVSPGRMLLHMQSALARGLKEVVPCKPHSLTLSIAGGGPSLGDTYQNLKGYIAAINGSLSYLLERDIVPNACGIVDPGEHIADLIVADPRVRYFVGSVVHPKVFDKLLAERCQVHLWHPSGQGGGTEEFIQARDPNWLMIGGGSTMGLRWMTLGYILGFRKFELHGLDSSFRNRHTHAYPDRADSKDRLTVAGRETRMNFLAQVHDFFRMLKTFGAVDPVEITMHGDGLLQDQWAVRQAYLARAQAYPRHDGPVTVACVNAGNYQGQGRRYVENLFRGITKNLTRPHKFLCFTDDAEPYADGIQKRSLPIPGLEGWLNKLSLFSPGTFKAGERVLYFDLDTLVTGPIDRLASYGGEFAMLDEFIGSVEPPYDGPQSAVMGWRGGFGEHIWRAFEREGKPDIPGGDQKFIQLAHGPCDLWQEMMPGLIASHKACQGQRPKAASLVCFHGLPRPHEVRGGWVEELWR